MTVQTAAPLPSTAPTLRLLPVPVCEPPYDDELPPRPASSRPPIGPLRRLPPLLRLVPDLPADDEEQLRPRTPASDLPPAQPVARALVQGLLEVLAGVRPLSQLQRGTSVELYARLEEQVVRLRRTDGPRPLTGAVRSLHVQHRDDGVAEVCATVHRGRRTAALALRLEGVGGRWCCTELDGVVPLSRR